MALLTEGSTIRETYEVEAFLGQGAFAEVYRIRHKFLGRQALKIFKAPGWSPEEIGAMLDEAALLSKISHPNIVRVYEANTLTLNKDTYGYFTMEYVAGGSLSHYWRSFGTQFLPVPKVVDIMRQVCRGIALAHSYRPAIVHRDIKPENVLIGHEADGIRAAVTDFGLAKRVSSLSLMATSRGTLSFKAPEALKNAHGDSARSDVWALGASLYLLLSDKMPYDIEEKNADAFSETFRRSLSPPSRWNALCDEVLDRIALRALQVDPKNRYASASEMLSELESWIPESPNILKDLRSTRHATSLGRDSTNQVSQRAETARAIALRSIAIAQDSRKLREAIAMMEQAIEESPELGEEYQARLRLWQRGFSI